MDGALVHAVEHRLHDSLEGLVAGRTAEPAVLLEIGLGEAALFAPDAPGTGSGFSEDFSSRSASENPPGSVTPFAWAHSSHRSTLCTLLLTICVRWTVAGLEQRSHLSGLAMEIGMSVMHLMCHDRAGKRRQRPAEVTPGTSVHQPCHRDTRQKALGAKTATVGLTLAALKFGCPRPAPAAGSSAGPCGSTGPGRPSPISRPSSSTTGITSAPGPGQEAFVRAPEVVAGQVGLPDRDPQLGARCRRSRRG